MNLSRERPTIAVLLVAFLTALLTWGLSSLPDAIPDEVRYSGYVLAVAVVAVLVGKAAQGEWLPPFLRKLLGSTAPWAHDTHTAAVALALFHDPNDEHLQLLLDQLGVPSLEEARRLVGLDEPAA